MSKTNKILLALVFILFFVLVALFVLQFLLKGPAYYAVLLRTGDLYFGRLVKFPSFGLKNIYTLQVNPQNAQTPVSIQKFTNVFWGPEDWLKINRAEVVWLTKLNSAGQLAELIKSNPNLLPAVNSGLAPTSTQSEP